MLPKLFEQNLLVAIHYQDVVLKVAIELPLYSRVIDLLVRRIDGIVFQERCSGIATFVFQQGGRLNLSVFDRGTHGVREG